MGLFSRRTSSASDGWPERPRRALVFDLARGALEDVSFGDDAMSLEFLGRPRNRGAIPEERFEYGQHGLIVELTGTEVTYFAFIFDGAEGYESCDLEFRFSSGAALDLGSDSAASDVLATLASDVGSDVDDEETVHRVRCGEFEVELEVTPGGILKRLNVYPFD